jgi:hypothetical protein
VARAQELADAGLAWVDRLGLVEAQSWFVVAIRAPRP